jgi:hypothetical protein
METSTIMIVLISINILTSFLSPLVLATSHFIKRIKKSQCCSSNVELTESDPNIKEPNKNNDIESQNVEIDKLPENIKNLLSYKK